MPCLSIRHSLRFKNIIVWEEPRRFNIFCAFNARPKIRSLLMLAMSHGIAWSYVTSGNKIPSLSFYPWNNFHEVKHQWMMLQKVRFRCLVARFSRQSGTPCLMQGSETVDRAGDITGFIGVEPFHAQCLLPSSFLWWIPTTSLTKQSTPMNWRKFLLPSRMCLCIQWSVEAQVIPWCSVHEYRMISRTRQAGEWF